MMNLEKIYPGIYLTSAKNLCSTECLKIFGFTHIIYIDKHIIEHNRKHQQSDDNKMEFIEMRKSNEIHYEQCKNDQIIHKITASITLQSTVVVDHNLPSTSSNSNANANASNIELKNENIFGHGDFETLDLNFGESSYLTTVLPNCYKAVKFIEIALKNNGAVLVIDCIGENQKCITIVIGFLMYKYNKNFL